MGACTQGFLPDDWMAKLENLQDRVPYESFEYVRGVIEAGLNERIHGEMSGLSVAQRNEELSDAEWISIDDVFEFIDPVPLGKYWIQCSLVFFILSSTLSSLNYLLCSITKQIWRFPFTFASVLP